MDRKWIYAALSIAMLFWGLNVIAIKVLVDAYPPITITAIRVTIAGLCVLLYTWIREGFHPMNRREWFFLFILVLTGIYFHHFFLSLGLKYTTSSNGSLILALNPLTTALLAFVFLRDPLSFYRALGILSGFFGVSLLVLRGSDTLVPVIQMGDLFIFIAMFSQALSWLFVRKVVATVPVNQVTGCSFLFGGLFLFLTGMTMEGTPLSAVISSVSLLMWVLLLSSALLATALGGMIWNHGIHVLGPAQTAIFINMTPLYGLVGAALFLGEVISWSHIIGFLFIATGVFLGSGYLDERKKRKASINKVPVNEEL
jgi:drug/metabolite transporter (DMT)-like permease